MTKISIYKLIRTSTTMVDRSYLMMLLLFQTFGKITLHVAMYNSQQIINNESHTKMYERVNKLLLLYSEICFWSCFTSMAYDWFRSILFQKNWLLIVVDYFSKYLIMRKIANSTSSAVIKELGMIFSEFGKPQVFRSDNGPCYASQEFRFFMQNWSIKHRTSSPHYPQSNGLAESMVKVSKNLIEK